MSVSSERHFCLFVCAFMFSFLVSLLDRDNVETEMMMEASDTEIEMWEESDKEEYRFWRKFFFKLGHHAQ